MAGTLREFRPRALKVELSLPKEGSGFTSLVPPQVIRYRLQLVPSAVGILVSCVDSSSVLVHPGSPHILDQLIMKGLVVLPVVSLKLFVHLPLEMQSVQNFTWFCCVIHSGEFLSSFSSRNVCSCSSSVKMKSLRFTPRYACNGLDPNGPPIMQALIFSVICSMFALCSLLPGEA